MDDQLPQHAINAAGLAERIAKQHAESGGDMVVLFAAFVGLVSARDGPLSCECLAALESALKRFAER